MTSSQYSSLPVNCFLYSWPDFPSRPRTIAVQVRWNHPGLFELFMCAFVGIAGRRGFFHRVVGWADGENLFPHLQAMDGNIGVGLETEPHLSLLDLQHRDFEQALKAIGAADHHGLLQFP